MKKAVSVLLALIMLCGSFACMADTQDEKEISVIIDGEKLVLDVSPIMIEGRTLIPLRAAFEAFEAKVEWDEVTSKAKCVHNDIDIEITIGSRIVFVNGERVVLDVASVAVNDRILVPLRFIAETLEADVEWNEQDQTVYITTKKSEPEKLVEPETTKPEKPVVPQKQSTNILDIPTKPRMTITVSEDELYKDIYTKARHLFEFKKLPYNMDKQAYRLRAMLGDAKQIKEKMDEIWNEAVNETIRIRMKGQVGFAPYPTEEKIKEVIEKASLQPEKNFRVHIGEASQKYIIIVEMADAGIFNSFSYSATIFSRLDSEEKFIRYFVGNTNSYIMKSFISSMAITITRFKDNYRTISESTENKYYRISEFDGSLDSFIDTTVMYMDEAVSDNDLYSPFTTR